MSERLHADDVERIAEAVVRRLREESPPTPTGLLSASEVAARLGVSRETVYRRASELGGVRVGTGARPRLRFDPERVSAALSARSDGMASPAPNRPPRRRSRGQTPGFTRSGAPLLPVPGPRGVS